MAMLMHLPMGGDQVDDQHARLPAAYESAKLALANCADIDECKDWADKAAAMASYAKQADDETLLNFSKRIKARAIRRVGELYNEIEPQPGTRTDLEPREGDLPRLTRDSVATAAGLSEHQRKTAARVANVPAEEFEAAVESDNPPTIEDLAERGTKKKTVIETTPERPRGPTQADWQSRIELEASVHRKVFGDEGRPPLPAPAAVHPELNPEPAPAPKQTASAPAQSDFFKKPAVATPGAPGAAPAAPAPDPKPKELERWEHSLFGRVNETTSLIRFWDSEFPGWEKFERSEYVIKAADQAAAAWAKIAQLLKERAADASA
jgi:hypothetical protein